MTAPASPPCSLATQVHELFRECLYSKEEIAAFRPGDQVDTAAGIRGEIPVNVGRAKERRAQIAAILDQMPYQFHRSAGGGWSFLKLALTKSGEHWAEHPTMEMLVVLAIASGQGGYSLMPRELWRALPGGMPYVWFDTTKTGEPS